MVNEPSVFKPLKFYCTSHTLTSRSCHLSAWSTSGLDLYYMELLEISFFCVASTCYLVFKVVAKLTYLVAIMSCLTTYYQIYDQTKFLWPYGIVFCLINRRNISVKIGLFFQGITFIKEFPGSNILLPTFLAGGEWVFRWQICFLLLLISNPAWSSDFAFYLWLYLVDKHHTLSTCLVSDC